jgi:small subunit ribosomal protein S7
VLDLLTNLIMRDGKKAEAQRRVTDVLTFLQRSTNAPPVSLVHQAVALASPSVRMVSMRKRAKTIQQPRALNERQRTHAGVKWILQAAERGRSKTAPRSQRIAREVLAIIDGSSDVVKKLEELHKTAMLNRCVLIQLKEAPYSICL